MLISAETDTKNDRHGGEILKAQFRAIAMLCLLAFGGVHWRVGVIESLGPVLVTGGAGYIGSHAVLALLEAGHDVIVLDNLSSGFRETLNGKPKFVHGNVGDVGLVRDLISRNKIRAVAHFAGSLLVEESVREPMRYYENNTANSRALISSAVAAGARHFLFSSTAAAYGVVDAASPISEEYTPQPINPYGWSKVMTEQMLTDLASTGALNFGILRYFNVAGADPLGRTGQRTIGATHLIKVAVQAALGRRESVSIFGDDYPTPDGTGVRDYIHVSDLATAHVHALSHLFGHPDESFLLNCGYGKGYSVKQVLDTVDRVAGVKIQRRIGGRRPGDPAMLIADNKAIRSKLGWVPKYDNLEAIVRHSLDWERSLALDNSNHSHG